MFIVFRNPTPEWSTLSEFPLWSPARKFPLDYLVIGNKNGNSEKLLSMEKDLFAERFAFWQKLKKESPKWMLKSFIGDDINEEL